MRFGLLLLPLLYYNPQKVGLISSVTRNGTGSVRNAVTSGIRGGQLSGVYTGLCAMAMRRMALQRLRLAHLAATQRAGKCSTVIFTSDRSHRSAEAFASLKGESSGDVSY